MSGSRVVVVAARAELHEVAVVADLVVAELEVVAVAVVAVLLPAPMPGSR